jgi:hypothetical protein
MKHGWTSWRDVWTGSTRPAVLLEKVVNLARGMDSMYKHGESMFVDPVSVN